MNITQLLQDYLAAEKMLADLGEKIGRHFGTRESGYVMTKLAQPKKAKKKTTAGDPANIRQRANDTSIIVMTFVEWCERNGYAKPDGGRDKNNYNKLYARYMTYKKNLIGGKSFDAAPPPPETVEKTNDEFDNDISDLL